MKVDLLEIAKGLTNEDYLRLIEIRGGCRCFTSPPCSACCEPITEFEAESLGLIPEEPGTTEMDAVRELCQPKGLK